MTSLNPSIPKTMCAVLLTGYGGVDKLEYREDVPVPQPTKNEVLVRVGACGINNTDVNLRTRWYDRAGYETLSEEVGLKGVALDDKPDAEAGASWNTETVKFPRIQGAAVVGRIAAIGAGVDRARIGERVILDPQIRDMSRLIFPRSGGHLSKLGMIRAEVMDGEYSTGIHG
jgi:NADPH:quinone reductase-like Zn-dependent oxidoreductase